MFALLKHPLVDCDFEEAALHYALRDAGLAERFIEVAESSLRELANDPFRHRRRSAKGQTDYCATATR